MAEIDALFRGFEPDLLTVLPQPDRPNDDSRSWELITESIVVRIRWFGIVMGYALALTRSGLHNASAVCAFLALGAGYAALDTAFHRMGEVFLVRWPLFVSCMESIFIALLCYHDIGMNSPFRWYYLLSLICLAIRYRPAIAWCGFGMHCLSLLALGFSLRPGRPEWESLPLTAVILAWATWATTALVSVLKGTGARLAVLNQQLERHGEELEKRVEERSLALQDSQARLIHQEKMAAFGLLSAGIAHEVGNPLAAISSLIQILQRRNPDAYSAEKLDLAGRQLLRIQRTIRELSDFARPSSTVPSLVRLDDVVEEVLRIAKYYQRTSDRAIQTHIPPGLPPVTACRDHLTQIVLNLIFNAIDAGGKNGKIEVTLSAEANSVILIVSDDGRGMDAQSQLRVFQPYFTTKPKGTGLGLFISRQIVEELGGSISFQSTFCEGTRFVVRFPASATIVESSPEFVPAKLASAEEVLVL